MSITLSKTHAPGSHSHRAGYIQPAHSGPWPCILVRWSTWLRISLIFDHFYRTVVLQTFYSPETPLKNGSATTSCESSLLDVSASYFTRMPSTVHNTSGPDAEIDPGSFKWTINAFNPTGKLDAVQAAYNGEKLNCSVSDLAPGKVQFAKYLPCRLLVQAWPFISRVIPTTTGLSSDFVFTFRCAYLSLWRICAKCKLVDRQNVTYGGAAHITVLDVCTNYARNVDKYVIPFSYKFVLYSHHL